MKANITVRVYEACKIQIPQYERNDELVEVINEGRIGRRHSPNLPFLDAWAPLFDFVCWVLAAFDTLVYTIAESLVQGYVESRPTVSLYAARTCKLLSKPDSHSQT